MKLVIAPLAQRTEEFKHTLAEVKDTLEKQAADTAEVKDTLEKQAADTAEVKNALEKQAADTAEVKDALDKQTAALEGIMDQFDMSDVGTQANKDVFHFQDIESDPPMVDSDDPRVGGLVQALHRLRSRKCRQFNTCMERLCRDNCIIPFFRAVADVYRATTIEPNEDKYQLRVLLGRKWFHGYTDLFVGGEKALIDQEKGELILVIEMKPIAGNLKLKGPFFTKEGFRVQAQIALQAAAIQSCCVDSTLFSCILTNLDRMYVVQVTSYNSHQITAQAFKCVTDESKFVRAVLKAADTNNQIQKQLLANRQSIMCVTSQGHDSHLSSLALGNISQIQAKSQGTGAMGAASHEPGEALDTIDGFDVLEAYEDLNVVDGSCTPDDVSAGGQDSDGTKFAIAEESEPCTWKFGHSLQSDEPPRACDKSRFNKSNLTTKWVRLVQEQQPFADHSSQFNMSYCTQVCPRKTTDVGQA